MQGVDQGTMGGHFKSSNGSLLLFWAVLTLCVDCWLISCWLAVDCRAVCRTVRTTRTLSGGEDVVTPTHPTRIILSQFYTPEMRASTTRYLLSMSNALEHIGLATDSAVDVWNDSIEIWLLLLWPRNYHPDRLRRIRWWGLYVLTR
jgi:hypothetical protein